MGFSMQKAKTFIIDFIGFYLAILVESFIIALSLLTYSNRIMARGITETVRPLIQQGIEVITHSSIILYHEMVLALSFFLIKIGKICIQGSRTLHTQARFIQSNYRWL